MLKRVSKITESGVEEGKVVVRKNALIKMLSHVYRFGSEILDINHEVFGVCLGSFKPEEKVLEVIDVIPILHGDEVELGFSKEIHMMLDALKKEHETEEVKVIGWYLSHLGDKYDIDFSNSDKFNHTYFQTEEHPYGFCIVINNTLLRKEENLGIKVYRLANFSKGVKSDYIKVNINLEKPNSLDYFKWVQKYVEEAQKENPEIIREVIEEKKPKREELQEIPLSEEASIEEQIPSEEVQKKLFDGIEEGTTRFNDLIINIFSDQFEKWMEDLMNGALKGVEKIRSTINQMNNTVQVGLEDVDRFFENSFNKKSNLFENSVKKDFNNTYQSQDNNEAEIIEMLNKVSEEYKELLKNNVEEIKHKLNEKVSNLEVRLHNVNQDTKNSQTQLISVAETINESLKEANNLSEEILTNIEKTNIEFEKNLKLEIDNLSLNSEDVSEKNKEIENLIDRLQKIISDFRQLK
jgi:hypothetical protein